MNIFGHLKPNIDGAIGYFGLTNWWLSHFSDSERAYIEQKYQPMTAGVGGRSDNNRPLTQGKIRFSTQTIGMFLSGLSSWFTHSQEDRVLARRILQKAIDVVDPKQDIFGLHFTYQALIQAWYKDRDIIPQALEETVKACQGQISIAPQAAKAFRKEYPTRPLVAHVGYEQLTIIRDKQGKLKEAIQIAKEAKKQGWDGDWDNRVERYEKKLLKQK